MGYAELIELATKLKTAFPGTKIKPLLDKDAEDYVKKPDIMNPTGNNAVLRASISILGDCITYLPITPEQGLVVWLLNSQEENYKKIDNTIYHHVDWNSLVLGENEMNEIQARQVNWNLLNETDVKRIQKEEKEKRDKSKEILEKVRNAVKAQSLDYSDDIIDRDLFQAYVEHSNIYNEAFLRTLFGRLFS